MTGVRRAALAGLAAACTATLAALCYLPPWPGPLAFVALAPLVWAARRVSVPGAFALGAVAGIGFHLVSLWWLPRALSAGVGLSTGVAVAVLAGVAVMQAVGLTLFAGLGRLAERRGLAPWLAWPAALVVGEIATPALFPWNLGASQWQWTAFVQSAEIWGAPGLSALVALVNVVLLDLLPGGAARPWTSRLRPALVAAAVVALDVGYGAVRLRQIDAAESSAPRLRVGLVQGNIDVLAKGHPLQSYDNLLRHQRLSLDLVRQGVDLVVWPETAFDVPLVRATTTPATRHAEAVATARVDGRLPRAATWVPAAADAPAPDETSLRGGPPLFERIAPHRGLAAPLLFGVLTARPRAPGAAAGEAAPPEALSNTAALLDAEGRVLGMADKQTLMPFYEYVPFVRLWRDVLGLDLKRLLPRALALEPGPGTGPVALPAPDGGPPLRLGVLVCYEDLFAREARRVARDGVDVLVNLTNDAWFAGTPGPEMHFSLSVLRAVESRAPLLRATDSGVTAWLDAAGRPRAVAPTGTPATLRAEVPVVRRGPTPWVVAGPWAMVVPAALVLAWAAWPRRRPARPGARGAEGD